MKHSRYGVVNWFVRSRSTARRSRVFGDGTIKRDFLYVDDCVEAILLAAASGRAARRQVLNVGVDDRATTFRELAVELRAADGRDVGVRPVLAERKAQEPGDFYSDISKIRRLLGWRPRTSLHGRPRADARLLSPLTGTRYW